MADQYDNIDDLLARKFAGETTPDEEAQLADWLRANPENARYMDEMRWVWEAAEQLQPDMPDVDTEAALKKVKAQLQPRSGFRWSYLGWLLLLLALAGGGTWLYRQSTPPPPQPEIQMAANDQLLTDTLSDGSTVVLNRHSSIVVEAGFNDKDRRTRLTGEAYFKVAPDKTRPFVVAVDRLEVRVVGTAFNIQENRNRGIVEITVTEGRVQLKSQMQEALASAGETVVFEMASGQMVKQSQPNPNALAYQNRLLKFDNTPLKSVAEQVKRAYDVDFVFNNKVLENCTLTTQFDNQPIEKIAQIVALTFNLTVHKDGQTFVFDGGACDE